MIAHRPFTDYAEYVYKQGGKARGRREHLLKHLEKNTEGFRKTFVRAGQVLRAGAPILCLGARTGAESLGADQAGFLGSVGIDLHPVGPTVLQGDWHHLEFRDDSFDTVYSNSLDHCLYLDRLCAEVRRVLMPGGRFYIMATNRDTTVDEWRANWAKSNEGLYWQTSDDLRDAIVAQGFTTIIAWRDGKWGHYVFEVEQC